MTQTRPTFTVTPESDASQNHSALAPSPVVNNVTPLPAGPQRYACAACDATLDNQQRYCLNCGSRSRYVTNPAVDYIAERQRKRGVVDTTGGDDGIAGTGVTKRALPWLIGSTLVALILGVFLGGLRKTDNNDALLAALAARPAAVAAPTGATAAVANVSITSDWTLDSGYTVQVATVPTGSDQAAVDAAKQAATTKGASDVGVINPEDYTVAPDSGGAYVIYSGEFKDEKSANAALKKIKGKIADAKVVKVTSTSAGADTEIPKGETSSQEMVKTGVSKEEAKKSTDKAKKHATETGDDYVDNQSGDVVINAPEGTDTGN
ncbi:MAG: SPOR domain-containing protein [Solirubrobacterales bacterium]